MKKYTIQAPLLAIALAVGLLFTGSGCNNGGNSSDGHDSIDTPQVVKVEPQNFPVNELPENYFGKKIAREEMKGFSLPAASLQPSAATMPEWLDQIISRESIVHFAQGILNAMPDEVEFTQSGSSLYDGADGWHAFVVRFATRPSNASILIYGGFKSEEESYWAGTFSKDALDFEPVDLKAVDGGVEMAGIYKEGGKNHHYKAVVKKDATEAKSSPL